ncbi:MAG: Stp1/IreP family PP2C-type Ser/Thr phosphatase [Polyangiaceae bacterium]|nr:Stp1/IreP family PP2C-type Ser/Thr phosphatase [Polyangiaceae bacterium]
MSETPAAKKPVSEEETALDPPAAGASGVTADEASTNGVAEAEPLSKEPVSKEPASSLTSAVLRAGEAEAERKLALEPLSVEVDKTDVMAAPVIETAVDSTPAPESSRGPIVVRVFGRTDVGQVRDHNEDNFLVADLTKASRGLMEGDRVQNVGDRGTLLGVCDGMGGAAAGEVASQLAVDIIYQRMLSGEPPTSHDELAGRLVSAIESAGARIFSEAKADRSRRGMGTTSTVAALIDDHLFFGQVGDSRAYLLRGDRMVQVTRDQSLVNQLIEAGQLTEEEAETFEHNNIILQALGTADTVQVDLTYVELRRGDVLLVCSDGLSGMVRNDEIREVLRTFDDPLEACRELTDRANQAGGHDNVTVVVARFEGEGLVDVTAEDVADLKYRKYELPETVSSRAGDVTSGAGTRSSMRPGRSSGGPSIEVGYDDYESEYPLSGALREDPVELPRDQAPSWIVTMMIVSAVTCVVVAGYYLLR